MQKKIVESSLISLYKKYIGNIEIINTLTLESVLIDLAINSVDYIKIIIDIENEFNIEFDDNDLTPGTFQTIGNMVDYILTRIS